LLVAALTIFGSAFIICFSARRGLSVRERKGL
jgi:hypothetical protein